jgi:superfamily I DNA/RNA helicase
MVDEHEKSEMVTLKREVRKDLKERIRIMTAHKSKGDESDYVFLL